MSAGLPEPGIPVRGPAAELTTLIGRRAQNLVATHQLLCSEAVLLVLNRAFGRELEDPVAIRLASAFPEGLGGGGCLCGSLAGGLLALGLFLGRDRVCGPDRHGARQAAAELHRRFREAAGSSCCRILNPSPGEHAHFDRCVELSGLGAAMAAEIILAGRPELLARADREFLEAEDSRLKAGLRWLAERKFEI